MKHKTCKTVPLGWQSWFRFKVTSFLLLLYRKKEHNSHSFIPSLNIYPSSHFCGGDSRYCLCLTSSVCRIERKQATSNPVKMPRAHIEEYLHQVWRMREGFPEKVPPGGAEVVKDEQTSVQGQGHALLVLFWDRWKYLRSWDQELSFLIFFRFFMPELRQCHLYYSVDPRAENHRRLWKLNLIKFSVCRTGTGGYIYYL